MRLRANRLPSVAEGVDLALGMSALGGGGVRTPVRGRMPPEPHTVKGGEPQQLGEDGKPQIPWGSCTVHISCRSTKSLSNSDMSVSDILEPRGGRLALQGGAGFVRGLASGRPPLWFETAGPAPCPIHAPNVREWGAATMRAAELWRPANPHRCLR